MTLYAAGDPLCGPLLSQVMAGALRMGECNACMKRIVAAPTAGACGVLPAVLLPCARHFSLSREQLVQALYVASGFGMVIAARASISGAEGCLLYTSYGSPTGLTLTWDGEWDQWEIHITW